MAKEKNSVAVITKELQQTVAKNPKIKEVYFNSNGEHFFKKYTIKLHKTNEENQVVSVEDVECLPGAKQSIVMIKNKVNGGIQWKAARRNTDCELIAETLDRKDVLSATPVASSKSEKEKLEILQAAAEIAKGGDFESLLKKLPK